MTKFAIIDRDTGKFLSYVSSKPSNVTSKQQKVYAPVVYEEVPVFDPDKEKLEPNNRAEPLPFEPTTRWIIGHRVVLMTEVERGAEEDFDAVRKLALTNLKGTEATVDQLISVLLDPTGK